MMRIPIFLATAAALALGTSSTTRAQGGVNDYPTAARAEYVFACMAANGNTQQSLQRCACSVDAIAGVLPYERYVQAETVLRIVQTPGERAELGRSSGMLRDIVADLRRAQAEAEVQCFP